jgi:hypothetical protein
MPVRTCVVCGAKAEKSELYRIADDFTMDEAMRMPGRGAYVCKTKLCVENFSKKTTITRSLRRTPGKDEVEAIRQRLKVINEREDS